MKQETIQKVLDLGRLLEANDSRDTVMLPIEVPTGAVECILNQVAGTKYDGNTTDEVGEGLQAFCSIVLAQALLFVTFDSEGTPYIDRKKVPADMEEFLSQKADEMLEKAIKSVNPQ